MAVGSHGWYAATVLSHLRFLQDRKLRLHVFRCTPKDIGLELEVSDTEARTELIYIEEGRLLFVNTPQESALARAHINRRIHDTHHRQIGARARHRLRHK